ncbi:hypothetical protein Ais01nite_83660 [Asanoa ishikariensis]|uniref:Secreted protein n=1 Tax=Asanoa ishikariensis TaxID=137265 RepID=A0A1H3S766_9ACTN|nr:hypothetical protein [Asanoa ishikariensis]GIF70331.1 hypothetical protein Ais01nite_83660 [Asanoa ishikariensis]SDZ33953.1 hypothetical protein SAMN05421684_4670 [Asanoa ishikariensis]
MTDLAINLVASALAAVAAWMVQRAVSYRRLARMRGFFGLRAGAPSLLIAGRHWSSPKVSSVHRNDMGAIVELGAIVKECGARADLVPAAEAPKELGKVTEFCIGGPESNPRTSAHLAALMPGVRVTTFEEADETVPIFVGTQRYDRLPHEEAHVLLARALPTAHPVFLLVGQTALSNLAAARYLAGHHRELQRKYGDSDPFCLVLKIRQPGAYGADLVELVADGTEAAFDGSTPLPALPRPRREWWAIGRRP